MKISKTPVTIYTDGACRGNPGVGGYGVVLKAGVHHKEYKGAYRLTTNNRMELMAVVAGLSLLTRVCKVDLYSDSKLIVDAFTKGWVKGWRKRNWMKSGNEPVVNADLWVLVANLCEIHEVAFHWVKGHAGILLNERCDALANEAMDGRGGGGG